MVRAWYRDSSEIDPGQPHMLQPGQFLTLNEVMQETGIECFQFDAKTIDEDEDFEDLREKRGYIFEDYVVMTSRSLPDYDTRMWTTFYAEHMHPDDEVRFVSDGRGYFDIRSRDGRWIRLEVSQNDLIIIPGGTNHRFCLHPERYIKLRRFFTRQPYRVTVKR